ncbi:hypothetical protein ACOSQ2_023237 [Xanthoceras sorbifolium]
MNETSLHHGCSSILLAAPPCEANCFPLSDYFDFTKNHHHRLITPIFHFTCKKTQTDCIYIYVFV